MIIEQLRKLDKTPSGNRHAKVYRETKLLFQMNNDSVIKVLTDSNVAYMDKMTILQILGHGGSVNLRHNEHMIPLLKELYSRKDEIGNELVMHLDWLIEVHDYPLD